MKIVMDFRKFFGIIGGVERGVIEIVKYVTKNQHTVILLCKKNKFSEAQELFKNTSNIKIIPLDVETHVICKKNIELDSTIIQDIAQKEQADIIHFPYNWSFPKNKKVPSILTIHDVIPFTFREAMPLFKNLFSYKPGIRKACQLNDIIATVSEFSKQDIVKKVGVLPEKIRVINNGLRETSQPDKEKESSLSKNFNLNKGFILSVGGIHERKNIVRLIEAFSLFVKKENYAGKLIITGSVSGAPYQIKMKKICDAAVLRSGLQDKIIFTGFIPDEDLDSLFRMANFLVYPSLYEGFGIPVLEAMQAGTPVITSNLSAMPEVAGQAAILVDPYNINSIVEAMLSLHQDPVLRQELSAKGKERAQNYSWEKTAKNYLTLYDEISR